MDFEGHLCSTKDPFVSHLLVENLLWLTVQTFGLCWLFHHLEIGPIFWVVREVCGDHLETFEDFSMDFCCSH